jgi:hypothetical protein
MIISNKDAIKIIVSKLEQLSSNDMETKLKQIGGEDGSIMIYTGLYWWQSDKQIHDEREPRDVFDRWLNDPNAD